MFFDTRRLHELRADSTESQVALLNAVFFLEEEEDNSNASCLDPATRAHDRKCRQRVTAAADAAAAWTCSMGVSRALTGFVDVACNVGLVRIMYAESECG